MNKKIIFLGTLLFVGSSVATAEDNPWYVGAKIGTAHYSDFETNDPSTGVKNNDELAGGVFLGYNINEWFALETGYTYLGKIEVDDTSDISNEALELVGKFTVQPIDSLDFFVKAGGAAYLTDGSGEASGLADNGAVFTGGVGTEYHFTKSFSARLEYQIYQNLNLDDKGFESEWDTDLLTLGFIYSWGAEEPVEVKEAPVVEEPAPVVVEPVVETMVVTQMTDVDFATDKDLLSAEATAQIQPMIDHLAAYPEATVVVIGHADSRGASAYNQQLSEKRAEAVSNYLTSEHSIAPDRIRVVGAGETDPVASNDTKEGREANRRVTLFSPSLTVPVK